MKQILLILSALNVSSFKQGTVVKVFGFYSNEISSDGEHSSGYSLHLWKFNERLVGLVFYNAGLIGDQAKGQIKDVKFNIANGDISFTSQLNGELINFTGIVQSTKVTGTFSWSTRIDKNQLLKSCCKDALIYKDYNSYPAWTKMIQDDY